MYNFITLSLLCNLSNHYKCLIYEYINMLRSLHGTHKSIYTKVLHSTFFNRNYTVRFSCVVKHAYFND